MPLRFFNGLQIDVPDGWSDLSTVVLAPTSEKRPSINLVVKRRPLNQGEDLDRSVAEYLAFMRESFGELGNIESRPILVGSARGRAVRFSAQNNGRDFRQTTFLYHHAGEEVSATVTQLGSDTTDTARVERLLASIKPAAGIQKAGVQRETFL
jgi:hypothetical protein